MKKLTLLITILLVPATFLATPQSPPNITVNGSLSPDKVQRGRSVRGVVTMEIPAGFHVNSNHPLEKFLIPTQLKIETARGLLAGPVSYPRAVLRQFKFSKSRVSVYEGRAVMRFTIRVPANFSTGATEVKARLRFQSCNDEMCFPPQNREVSLWLNVQ
ncbi:MAG TPA: protein-disulfide reductase DsbD domain-containing protein [Pyrinomonadaceae bacterium]|nr:protein-disulfide reductase DsbD domain-containing protein [Pyrinomonadaceae bacterium]